LIPRIDTLNSGVVPLAFQFARVVVGPDIGNIGPMLKAAGNPVFDTASVSNCVSAIEAGLQLASAGLGRRNAARAKELWTLDKVAAMHRDVYESVLKQHSRCGDPIPPASRVRQDLLSDSLADGK
jgi:hypothetical protein